MRAHLVPVRYGPAFVVIVFCCLNRQDWDNMERMWQQCLFKYLRCEPEEHHVMLTEPPLNTPENR